MEAPPLSLSVLHLTPFTLLLDPSEDPPPPSPLPPTPIKSSRPCPTFSPTHSYPSPYPSCTLGSSISLGLSLRDTSKLPVTGVKMMCEIQTPGGRFRLGEVIHGQTGDEPPPSDLLPELGPGEEINMDVETECKELGLCVIIVSVAWETVDGRRTFQRFFKFNVIPPLAIKTRIHSSQHPNTYLDSVKREWVYLEVLAQNVSQQGMQFDRVRLEPVHGLDSRNIDKLPATITSDTLASGEVGGTSSQDNQGADFMPGDTRQYLFILSPTPSQDQTDPPGTPKSSFAPVHGQGMILPLGRLDLSWRAGDAHDIGRLQTSTLNRRIPVAVTGSTSLQPTRTSSALSPSPMARMGSTNSIPAGPETPRTPGKALPRLDSEEGWEWDLVVVDVERDGVEVETQFGVTIKIGVRSLRAISEDEDGVSSPPPPPPIIGVQYLSTLPPPPSTATRTIAPAPSVSVLPPSRTSTPMSPGPSTPLPSRALSPLSSQSRPSTPVSSQLRQATLSHIGGGSPLLPPIPIPPKTTFPPAPISTTRAVSQSQSSTPQLQGSIQSLGCSLIVLPPSVMVIVEERLDTTYTDIPQPPKRWETTQEVKLRFVAVQEGLADLGGLRVLLLDDDTVGSGSVGREWESLGDVWVTP